MATVERLHRFTRGGRRFVIDVETCFCFECDDITAEVLSHYPQEPVNRILHLLESKHDRNELSEVIGELEWLRATKSILPVATQASQEKWLTPERDLQKLSIDLRGEAAPVAQHIDACIELLLGRAGKQQRLELELVADSVAASETIALARRNALRAANLAAKEIAVFLRIPDIKATPDLAPHALSVRAPLLDDAWEARVQDLLRLTHKPARLAAIAKLLQISGPSEQGSVTLHVSSETFAQDVQKLHAEGFQSIALDLDRNFTQPFDRFPNLRESLEATAAFYAERLLHHDYFRLEPLASLFRQIHQGTPEPRRDPSGTHALMVDADGLIRAWSGASVALGTIVDGEIDGAVQKSFDDIGSETTASCRRCWARNLCGGGIAAVHETLSGSMRTPAEDWCNLQRDGLEIAVTAFNVLAGSGVSFDRIYSQLERKTAPSLFQIAKAAFRSDIGLRPLAEADAELLRNWETWNRAAYFLLNERGIVAGNAYERELDATHPRAGEFEMMIVTKKGQPAGLLKVRPGDGPGVADLFLYLRDPASYRSQGVARGLRGLIKDAASGQSLRSILTPVAPWETGLATLLVQCGFTRAGTRREALYTKSQYYDADVYIAGVAQL